MKKRLLLFLLLAACLTGHAQQQWYAVSTDAPDVPLAPMTDVAFFLTSDYSETLALVHQDGTVTNGLAGVSFRQFDTSAIRQPAATPAAAALYAGQVAQHLMLMGTTSGQKASLFSLSGELLRQPVMHDGQTEVYVGDLPQGVYLLTVGTTTIKWTKK